MVVLTKADLDPDAEARRREIERLAAGVPVHAVSCLAGWGLEALRPCLRPGRTVALLGSSGVGKSTLVNALMGAEVARAGEVRPRDGRGRHTTTVRQTVALPGGGLVMDTPGLRELALLEGDEGFGAAFADVETLARECRFRDCGHEHEPGCAVQAAIAEGRLDPDRLRNYRRLQRELAYLEGRKRARRRRGG